MITYLYLQYRNIILIFIALLLTASTLLLHKDVVAFIAEKYAAKYEIKYSHIKGTILFGVEIKNLIYKDTIEIKSLQINYNLLSLLSSNFQIDELKIDSPSLEIEKVLALNSDTNSSSTIPSFKVNHLFINNAQLSYKKELYKLTIDASNINSEKEFNVKKLALQLNSSYLNTQLNGSIISNKLKAQNTFLLKEPTLNYLDFLNAPPKKVFCMIEADQESLKLSTKFKSFKFKEQQSLNIKDIDTLFNYSFANKELNITTSYKLFYEEYELQTQQKINLKNSTVFTSYIDTEIIKTPLNIPFQKILSKIWGDSKRIDIDLNAGKVHYSIHSSDYKRFSFKGAAKEQNLLFLSNIPKILQQDIITLTNIGEINLSPFKINSTLQAHSHNAELDMSILYEDSELYTHLNITPKIDSKLFKNLPIEKFSPLMLEYRARNKKEHIKIDANLLKMTLIKDKNYIHGTGTLASNSFQIKSHLDTKPTEIELKTEVKSLKKLLKELTIPTDTLSKISDIAFTMQSSLILNQSLTFHSTLFIPSIAFKSNEQTTYLLKDITLQSTFKDKILSIQNYRLNFKGESIYSDKESIISLNQNSDLEIKEFWIFDNLLLTGNYRIKEQKGEFKLNSEKFHYKKSDADVEVAMHLHTSIDSNKTVIGGDITLLNGKISYMPSSNYSISDPDIIILQEHKAQKESPLFLDIKINADKEILYQHKKIKFYFKPDIRVIKTAIKDTHLKGEIAINRGEIELSDKKFILEKSALYFDGNIPVNPELNLNLHFYTLDYIDILISLTHRLDKPIFILSSKPYLSQNDILSYILFGESSSSMLDPSQKTSTTSLLLATGLKELFNANSKVKLDTLNLLTNSDGTLGYEIGSRFNKHIRVIYRDDTIASLILQYSLTKSTRIDVDVRETGQGVSFIYIKDF